MCSVKAAAIKPHTLARRAGLGAPPRLLQRLDEIGDVG
eukprot:COSAG01_NODE_42988_length_434_cov_1.083582_2_plen_37_part_01